MLALGVEGCGLLFKQVGEILDVDVKGGVAGLMVGLALVVGFDVGGGGACGAGAL